MYSRQDFEWVRSIERTEDARAHGIGTIWSERASKTRRVRLEEHLSDRLAAHMESSSLVTEDPSPPAGTAQDLKIAVRRATKADDA
jgi:hypothetical protein